MRTGVEPTSVLITLGLLIAAPFLLNYNVRHTVLIPSAILLSGAATHILVLVREISSDPTSHNLWPFELIGAPAAAIPVFLGAILARLA